MKFRPVLCPEPLWESLVRADASATFFQTPSWHKLAEDFEGTRSRALLFDFGDGAQAVLPLQDRKLWWGTLLTSPFGTYATPLCSPRILPEHLDQMLPELSRLNLEIPGSPFSSPLPLSMRSPVSRTRILRLDGLEPEAWVASWSRNHRRMLKSAREAGYTVRLAENAADVSRYDAVYREQTERWGSAVRRTYSGELFLEAFRRFGPGNTLKLWLAESQGNIVAGRLCLYHGFHAVEWHAAATQKAMEAGVNHLLVHAAVADARSGAFGVYDFNPNPGLDAVDHFKRGFATEQVEFHGFRNRAGLAGAIAALRDGLRGKSSGE